MSQLETNNSNMSMGRSALADIMIEAEAAIGVQSEVPQLAEAEAKTVATTGCG